MAQINAIPATRAALLISLSTLLGACSIGKGAPVVSAVMANNVAAEQRYSDVEETTSTFTIARDRDELDGMGSISNDAIDPNAPTSYTVVQGDTMWDISDRFLSEPWLWPQLWNDNPQIKDPHLIFPGDLIGLEYINGQPRLVIERDGRRITQSGVAGGGSSRGSIKGTGAAVGGTEKLSPRIRSQSLDNAIPMIPGDAIASFLVHPRVIPLKEIESAPYVVGNYDGRLISALGHQIYARGNITRDQPRYAVFRQTKKLVDPGTKKTLGYEVKHVSDAKLMHLGDPSTLVLTTNKMETIAGDLLMATNDDRVSTNYQTRMPALAGGGGRVVSLVNSISQSGRDQVVVLNLGKRNKIQPGDVLAIESQGDELVDVRGKRGYEKIRMPNTRTGVVMVFKTFDEVSYALVMESTLPVRVNDGVTGI